MSKPSGFGDIIKEARKQERGKAVNTASGKAGEEREVSMTIKVPLRLRRHYVSRAKAEGTTITKEVLGFLQKRFGEPE